MQSHGKKDFNLIGYDLLERNVTCLKEGSVSFLIAQQPELQGFNGIKALCDHLIFKKEVTCINYMPCLLYTSLKLIPSAELGRPRIDVVVQTSGQLRDLAASRLFLINRAVEMAAGAKDDKYENQVATSVIEAERVLTEKGLSPKDAREISTFRIFGGINGMYGTGRCV